MPTFNSVVIKCPHCGITVTRMVCTVKHYGQNIRTIPFTPFNCLTVGLNVPWHSKNDNHFDAGYVNKPGKGGGGSTRYIFGWGVAALPLIP